jgi:superfamily II DNA or RNA helicase
LEKATDSESRQQLLDKAIDEILLDIAKIISGGGSAELRSRVLAWLIATEKLEIRFAFPSFAEDGMLHEKIGVISFPNGDIVAFTGSANESFAGHSLNYESVDVYRSWYIEEQPRIEAKKKQFWDAWNGRAKGLIVTQPTPALIQSIVSQAPSEDPIAALLLKTKPPLWRHQRRAVLAFLVEGCGILEMATGTGKTRTAVEILLTLLQRGLISRAVVTTEGTDLLDQWVDALLKVISAHKQSIPLYQDYERHEQILDYLHQDGPAILVTSRYSLKRNSNHISRMNEGPALLIDDEIHGLGSESNREQLGEVYSKFEYRLGLSATPERAYDDEGNAFIQAAVGDTVFLYGLEQAISDGVLCEFDYFPLAYELSGDDRQRLQAVYKKEAARLHAGNPMSPEEVWIELSRVYKTAEMKPIVFARAIRDDSSIIENCIIFVETMDYGERVMHILHEHTPLYRSYFSGEDSQNLLQFAKGKISTLVTCHRLSQGIDFPGLKNIVLFASSRSKLETIQRIGRALRVNPRDPRKRARVFDFYLEQSDNNQTVDSERVLWLSSVSKTRRRDRRS